MNAADLESVVVRKQGGATWGELAAELGLPETTLRGRVNRHLGNRQPPRRSPAAHPPAAADAVLPGDVFGRPVGSAALTTKYRPQCLRELLGQPDVAASLAEFADNPHPCAFLFVGDSGTGKTSAAYALAHELGVAVADGEFGGMFEVPSGSQSAEHVRKLLDMLHYRPLAGSGWRVCVINECDRMSLPCETIWLDALERLPPSTVVVFSTNDPGRLSRRFRDRCETLPFTSDAVRVGPWIRALVGRVWAAEGMPGECPAADTLGMPTMDCGDGESFTPSFRLALQQLQRLLRDGRRQRQGGNA